MVQGCMRVWCMGECMCMGGKGCGRVWGRRRGLGVEGECWLVVEGNGGRRRSLRTALHPGDASCSFATLY